MRQRKIVSLIGALAVVLSAVLMMTGCPQVPDVKPGAHPVKGTIEFDESVKCEKWVDSYADFVDVRSGDQIQETDKLQFTAKLPAGKIVDDWYINNVKQKNETNPNMNYEVKASDFFYGNLYVRFTTKIPVKGNIEFDTTITCLKSSDYIYNGDQIQENDFLEFTAKLPAGKIVDVWYINNVKQEYSIGSKHMFIWGVKATDFVDGKLKVRFTAKIPVKGNVEFDTTITCRTSSYNIYNGDQIQETDSLEFTANLPEDKAVDKWYINNVEQEDFIGRKELFISRVKATDFVDGKLKVWFTTRAPLKGNIEFDATITCKKLNVSPPADINTGDQIQENDELEFTANLPADKLVHKWYIGDSVSVGTDIRVVEHTVTAADFVDGKLKVRAFSK
ncbi:MAG: hypothetical protein ACTTHG_05440 [Treponemataceae bacterium]